VVPPRAPAGLLPPCLQSSLVGPGLGILSSASSRKTKKRNEPRPHFSPRRCTTCEIRETSFESIDSSYWVQAHPIARRGLVGASQQLLLWMHSSLVESPISNGSDRAGFPKL
jgi:hypothetical protein